MAVEHHYCHAQTGHQRACELNTCKPFAVTVEEAYQQLHIAERSIRQSEENLRLSRNYNRYRRKFKLPLKFLHSRRFNR